GREPATPYRIETQGFGTLEAIAFRIEGNSPDRSAGYEPIEGDEGVVTRNARCVGAGTYRDASGEHLSNRWGSLCLPGAGAVHKILALKRHPVLDGNSTAEGFDALEVTIRDGFTMVEEPMQIAEGNLTIHLFVHVESV